jgi:hypothetical protein
MKAALEDLAISPASDHEPILFATTKPSDGVFGRDNLC